MSNQTDLELDLVIIEELGEDRPDDCRSFPHLHKPDFSSRVFGVLQNYSVCPIVFNVVERLKGEVGYRY